MFFFGKTSLKKFFFEKVFFLKNSASFYQTIFRRRKTSFSKKTPTVYCSKFKNFGQYLVEMIYMACIAVTANLDKTLQILNGPVGRKMIKF